MSIFSSLSYLLKKASFAIHQATSTIPSYNYLPSEVETSNNFSLIVDSESSIINGANYDEELNETIENNNVAVINSSIDITSTKVTTYRDLPISFSNGDTGTEDFFTNKSDIQYSNGAFQNSDLLLENWWNILDERYLRHGWGWTITLIIAYMLILVVGVIGNLMVILVVSLRPQMRTVTNMFIMNLAIADLFVVVFCVPSTLLANIFTPWILGSFLCKALAYVQGVSVCASAYSLAAISLDRCQAIYRNLERPRGFSRKKCIAIVFLIWIFATSLTIPWAMMFNVQVSKYDGQIYCIETWEVEKHGKIYFLVVNLSCYYAIPLLLIFISNWAIYFQVMRRKVPEDSPESSATIRKMHRQTRHDVFRMLAIVTLTFLFSWLPLYILVIIIKFTEKMSESEYSILEILMPIAQWLGSWNSSMNPMLYAFLNKKFRRMLKSILPSWIPKNSFIQYKGPSRTKGCDGTAYMGKRFTRSRRNSRNCDHLQNGNGLRKNGKYETQLESRYMERNGTVVTKAKLSTSTSSPTTSGSSGQTIENYIDMGFARRNTNKIITNL